MNKFAGFALVALSAAAFGLLPIFARFAYADVAGTNTLLFLRFAIAGAVMLLLMRVRRIPFPRGGRLLGVALMGAIGYTGQSLFYFTALTYASASLVALMLYVYPALVALLSALFLRERITAKKAFALGLALLGTALILGLGGTGDARGLFLALGAAAVYSVYIVAGSLLIGEGMAIQSSTVIMLSAALVFGLLTAASGFEPPRTASGIAALLAIVLVSTVAALVAFFAGLERIGATSAAMTSTLEPLVTVTAAAAFLGESLGPMSAAGGALILASLVVLTRAPSPPAEELGRKDQARLGWQARTDHVIMPPEGRKR
ncbi:MAG: DMT family transporter [Spirochaetota bacterium]